MKKTTFIITAFVVGLAILGFGIANSASAAGLLQTSPTGTDFGGNGHHGTTGTGTGIPVEQNINLDGALEDLIHENLATALGLTPEELSARLDAGETLYDIAMELGYDPTEIRSLMSQARLDALTQAVEEGIITQEQADWLTSRGSQQAMNGANNNGAAFENMANNTYQTQSYAHHQGTRKGKNR